MLREKRFGFAEDTSDPKFFLLREKRFGLRKILRIRRFFLLREKRLGLRKILRIADLKVFASRAALRVCGDTSDPRFLLARSASGSRGYFGINAVPVERRTDDGFAQRQRGVQIVVRRLTERH